MKICFIASSGGHLEQIIRLNPLMNKYDSFLITEKTDFKSIEPSYYICQINRRERMFIFKFAYIFLKCLFIFIKERPKIVISTGALASFPMCIIGKLFGAKIIFIESFAKTTDGTITGKLVYKFADLFIIQWESLLKVYPNAIYGGGIY